MVGWWLGLSIRLWMDAVEPPGAGETGWVAADVQKRCLALLRSMGRTRAGVGGLEDVEGGCEVGVSNHDAVGGTR